MKRPTYQKQCNRRGSYLLLATASFHQSSNTWSRSSSIICPFSRVVPFVMFLLLHCCNCSRRLRTTSLSLWIFLSCDNNIFSLTASSLVDICCCCFWEFTVVSTSGTSCCLHSNCEVIIRITNKNTSSIDLDIIPRGCHYTYGQLWELRKP